MDGTPTRTEQLTVYLIDDDEIVLQSLEELLLAAGHHVEVYQSADAFLSDLTAQTAGCLVTDLKMDGMSGLELQRELLASSSPLPIIVVSGYASVPATVELMKNGAVTLLQKPCVPCDLLAAVNKALAQFQRQHDRDAIVRSIQKRMDLLTAGETSVLELMIAGRPNKNISTELNISMRTVDRRRSLVLEKMQVASAPELARLVTILETAVNAP